jgi:porin
MPPESPPLLVYDGSAFENVRGGVKTGSTYVGNLHLQHYIDLSKALGIPRTLLFLSALHVHGGQPSDFVGDVQGVSNMQAPHGYLLEEAWVQHNFASDRYSWLFGRYDLNSEFYRLTSAGLFLNSSFGIGPEFSQSGVAGPSIFPNTALGLRLGYKPAPNVVLRVAVLDAVPYGRRAEPGPSDSNGVLIVSEAAFLTRPAPEQPPRNRRFRIGRRSGLPPYESKVAFGVWHYTGTFDDLDPDASGAVIQRHGSTGGYVLADHPVYQSKAHPDRQLNAFVQIGVGDGRVNQVGSYIGSGVVLSSPFGSRPNDELGLGVALARNGSHYMTFQTLQGTPAVKSETAIELTYLAQIHKRFVVQPNFQYVIRPGTDPSIRNSISFQLRFEIAY